VKEKPKKLSPEELAELMNKDWHELPPDLRDQLLGLEVTTDEERMEAWLKRRDDKPRL
jgi:hypothetical protein